MGGARGRANVIGVRILYSVFFKRVVTTQTQKGGGGTRLLCRCGGRGGVDGAVVGGDDSDGLDMMTMVVAGGVKVRWLSWWRWGSRGDDVGVLRR
ncbi:hypothetical protein Tco_0611574 [Tanacetum coccineum]